MDGGILTGPALEIALEKTIGFLTKPPAVEKRIEIFYQQARKKFWEKYKKEPYGREDSGQSFLDREDNEELILNKLKYEDRLPEIAELRPDNCRGKGYPTVVTPPTAIGFFLDCLKEYLEKDPEIRRYLEQETARRQTAAIHDRIISSGIDEREFKERLSRLNQAGLGERRTLVERWYGEREIDAGFKEALLSVIGVIEAELRASEAEIRRLQAEGRESESEILARLNAAMCEGGMPELEKAQTAELAKLEATATELARTKAMIRTNVAEKYAVSLEYEKAAWQYAQAAETLLPAETEQAWNYRMRSALLYYQQGKEFGDNAALGQAINGLRILQKYYNRENRPLDWAMTQNNLGTALSSLGEREPGTARLEKAVTAYREALVPC